MTFRSNWPIISSSTLKAVLKSSVLPPGLYSPPVDSLPFTPLKHAGTSMPACNTLFFQIVKDTQKLLRLNIQLAQGQTALRQKRDQLANALQVKQALLAGLEKTGQK